MIAAAIVAFFAAVGVFALGMAMMRRRLWNSRMAHASSDWPIARGRVMSSAVQTWIVQSADAGPAHYTPEVAYTYSIGDRTYTGHRVAFRDPRTWQSTAEEIIAKYAVGQEVDVRYDPLEPERCVLEPGYEAPTFFATGETTGLAVILLVFGGLVAIGSVAALVFC